MYVWMLKLLIKLSVAMTMEGKGKPGDYNDDIYDNDDIPTIVACHVSLFVNNFIGIVHSSDIYIYFRRQKQSRVAQ